MQRRDFLAGAAALGVMAACGPDYERATAEQVRAARYRHPGPSSIALLSMVSTDRDVSDHVGILINGSERVIYDPAGNFDAKHLGGIDYIPRKYDINFGVTDRVLLGYRKFHARFGFYVETLEIEVPLAVADRALALAIERGETSFTQCATSSSWVLQRVPGFESIRSTMSPQRLRRMYRELPNIKRSVFEEFDDGKNYDSAVVAGNPADIAPPRKPQHGRGEG